MSDTIALPAAACPPRLLQRPAADPPRRPAEGHRRRDLRRRQPSRRACSMPSSRSAPSRAAASPRSTSRRPRRIPASSRSSRRPTARRWRSTRRQGRPVRLPLRRAAERPRALCQAADRAGRRRDAGGGHRRRAPAGPDLRGRAGAHRLRRRRALRSARRRHRRRRPTSTTATSPPALPPPRTASRRPTRRRPQYHNAMEPHAMVAEWDGDRLTLDTPNQAIVMSRAAVCRLFRHPARERAAAQPVPRRRLRLEGDPERAVDPGHPRRAHARAAGQAGAAARPDVRPGRPSRRDAAASAARHGCRGPADRAGAPCRRRRPAASTISSSRPPTPRTTSMPARRSRPGMQAVRARHRHARPDAGARRGLRLGGAGMRHRRGGGGLRPRPAGVPPAQLRRDRAGDRQAVLVQGAARMLRPGRRGASAGPAARWRRARCATRPAASSAGAWAPRCSRARCSRPTARATLRADGTALVETAGADMGQGAWTALAQIAADGLGLDIDRVEFRSGTSDLPDGGVAGGSGHTATAGIALHNAGTDAIAKLAELATADPASPLFGAGNAGVEARDGRLYRRDDESRSESYADILARAGMAELEGNGTGARDPAERRGTRDVLAWRGLRRGQGRSRSRPDAGHPPGRRLCRRPHHQPAAGAQPALWRHDLGHVLRAARGGDARPAHRPDR